MAILIAYHTCHFLERSSEIIDSLSRGSGLSGTWYGVFSQTTRTNQGEKVAFNDFVRIDLVESAGKLVGKGQLGSQQVIELMGRVNEQQVTGTVANTTSAINSSFSGIATDSQITAEFTGIGLGERLVGTVILLR